MKKIVFVSIMTLFISSCGDIYKDERGKVFEGAWTLQASYAYSSGTKETLDRAGRFIQARNFEGEDFLLFYSNGIYDSSFFYRIQDSVLFVRKVIETDSVFVRVDTNPNGVADSVKQPLKPLYPKTNYAPEKCYGVFTFSEGATMIMRIRRYALDQNNTLLKNILLFEDIYERPKED